MGWREDHIYDRLHGKPHLIPVFTSVYKIPERLKELDENFFVVFNTRKQRFEVHSLGNKGDTFGFAVPVDQLDYRTIYLTRKSNLWVRGEAIFREVDANNERVERSYQRQRGNAIEDFAKESKNLFAKFAWS